MNSSKKKLGLLDNLKTLPKIKSLKFLDKPPELNSFLAVAEDLKLKNINRNYVASNSNKPFTGLQDLTDKDFFNVTLALGDEQIKAHQIIPLANILCRNRSHMPASGVQNSTAQIIEPGDATIEVPLGRFAVCDMKQTVGLHVKKAPDKVEETAHLALSPYSK